MGDILTLYRQSFQLPPEHEEDSLHALKVAHAREPLPIAVPGGGKDPIAGAATLEAALHSLGFSVRRDGRGYIIGIGCAEDLRPGVDQQLFPILGPFVEEESFVDLTGHPDDGLTRYRFDGKGCVRRHVRISHKAWIKYVDTHEQEMEAAEQRQKPTPPSWNQVSKSMPAAMPAYDATARFAAGTWLQHAKFGPGFVVVVEDGKIRVLFESSERTLVARR